MRLLEYFKPFESLMVSNMGRVIGSRGKEMKQQLNPNGYLKVSCKRKSYFVHRLVGMLFIPNPHPDEWTELDHINLSRTTNHVGNLRWCSRSFNQRSAYATRRELTLDHLTPRQRAAYAKHKRPVDYRGQTYASALDLAGVLGVCEGTVLYGLKMGWLRGYRINYSGQPNTKPKPRPLHSPIEYCGKVYDSLKELAQEKGVSGTAISNAVRLRGLWRGHAINYLGKPPKQYNWWHPQAVEYRGQKFYSTVALAEACGVSATAVRLALKRGSFQGAPIRIVEGKGDCRELSEAARSAIEQWKRAKHPQVRYRGETFESVAAIATRYNVGRCSVREALQRGSWHGYAIERVA